MFPLPPRFVRPPIGSGAGALQKLTRVSVGLSSQHALALHQAARSGLEALPSELPAALRHSLAGVVAQVAPDSRAELLAELVQAAKRGGPAAVEARVGEWVELQGFGEGLVVAANAEDATALMNFWGHGATAWVASGEDDVQAQVFRGINRKGTVSFEPAHGATTGALPQTGPLTLVRTGFQKDAATIEADDFLVAKALGQGQAPNEASKAAWQRTCQRLMHVFPDRLTATQGKALFDRFFASDYPGAMDLIQRVRRNALTFSPEDLLCLKHGTRTPVALTERDSAVLTLARHGEFELGALGTLRFRVEPNFEVKQALLRLPGTVVHPVDGGARWEVALDLDRQTARLQSTLLRHRPPVEDTFSQALREASTPSAERGYTWVDVNRADIAPGERDRNCFNVAVAVDSNIRGNPASALPLRTELGLAFSTTKQERVQQQAHAADPIVVRDVGELMGLARTWGSGGVGIVRLQSSAEEKLHYFNIVNVQGEVRLLEGQYGLEYKGFPEEFVHLDVMRTPNLGPDAVAALKEQRGLNVTGELLPDDPRF